MSQATSEPPNNVLSFKHPQCATPGKAPRRRGSKPDKQKKLVAALLQESERMEQVADFMLLTSKELKLLARSLYEVE